MRHLYNPLFLFDMLVAGSLALHYWPSILIQSTPKEEIEA